MRWVDASDVASAPELLRLLQTSRDATTEVEVAVGLGHSADFVVIDNLDGVAEHAGDLLSAVCAAAPGLQLLCTSRVRLHARLERSVLVQGLGPADATALVLERTGWPAEARAAAADLALSLDGHPLAIELVSASSGGLWPALVASRSAEILARGHLTGVPDRHATLEAVVRWSWEQLSPAAQHVLEVLCMVPSPLRSEDAERVLGPDFLDGLLELTRQSLAAAVGGRVRTLMPVRTFVQARSSDRARSRQPEIIARMASQGATGDPTLLDAVLRWAHRDAAAEALPLCRAWADADPLLSYAEVGSRIEAVLSRCGGAATEVEVARTQIAAAEAWQRANQLAKAATLLLAAEERARTAGDREVEALALITAAGRGPDPGAREAAARRALELLSSDRLRAKALLALGYALRAGRGGGAGAAELAEVLEVAGADAATASAARIGLAAACRTAEQATTWLAQTRDEQVLARHLPNLRLSQGWLAVSLGRFDEAIGWLIEARSAFLRIGDRANGEAVLSNLTLAHLGAGSAVVAARYAREGIRVASELGLPSRPGMLRLALCEVVQGDEAAIGTLLQTTPATSDECWVVAFAHALARDRAGVDAALAPLGNAAAPGARCLHDVAAGREVASAHLDAWQGAIACDQIQRTLTRWCS